MVRLQKDDRRAILSIMESIPAIQTYRGRRLLLEAAGLDLIVPQLDLEGPPYVVAGDILHTLESYGRVTFDHEALGLLLNTLKDSLGQSNEWQITLDNILQKYHLMTPVKMSDTDITWKGDQDPNGSTLLEKIIGENTLKHIMFLEQAIKASRSIVLIDTGKWVGTGFMIGTALLLTNHHVLPDISTAIQTNFLFNYQLTIDGQEANIVRHRVKNAGIFYTDDTLDYTIVELDKDPGLEWGKIQISSDTMTKGNRVYIIQHPGGQPKQISLQNNFVEYTDSKLIQYITATLPGSSGSPVFNELWHAVGLHHAGGMIMEPNSNKTYFRNEGIAMNAILRSLPRTIIDIL